METTKHSPLPWRMMQMDGSHFGWHNGSRWQARYKYDDGEIGQLAGMSAMPLIVAAVNSHAANLAEIARLRAELAEVKNRALNAENAERAAWESAKSAKAELANVTRERDALLTALSGCVQAMEWTADTLTDAQAVHLTAGQAALSEARS